MYLLGVLVLLVVLYFIFLSKKTETTTDERFSNLTQRVENATEASKRSSIVFDNPIPKGFQIFASNLPVAGIQHRKVEAIRFAQSRGQALTMKREPSNPHDSNAIQLIGISDTNEYFIGYLPRELSEQIVATGLYDSLQVRLTRIYIGTDDYLEFQYQILGPKAEKKRFDAFLDNQAAATSQKEYLKFFRLPVPKGMTAGQAEEAIKKHGKTSTETEQNEWLGYTTILEEFDDPEFREGYNLKKVPKSILLEVIKQMKEEGKTYSHLGDHVDEVAERLIKAKPELEKNR